MADIVKLVPDTAPGADDALEAAKGEFDEVLILGWGEDGFEYRTNSVSFPDMAFLLMHAHRAVLDDSEDGGE